MHKELIISIVIIIAILGLNKITQDNTNMTVETIKKSLNYVRQDIIEKERDYEKSKKDIIEVHNKWEELDDKLAYYIEHDELEKIKTAITSIQSYIEVEEYEQAVESLDRCNYLLEHVDEREMFTLDNIF